MTAAGRVVQAFLDALRARDLNAACALLADDALVDEAVSLPFGGRRIGPDGFRSIVTDLAGQFHLRLGDQEVHDAGPFVVVTFQARVESRRTGRAAEMGVVDLYTVDDDRIVRLDVYYKDTHQLVALNDDNADPGERSNAA